MSALERIEIGGYRPGTLGPVLEIMMAQYTRSHRVGPTFEARMATGMADFLRKFDPSRDLFLIPRLGPRVVGSLAVEGDRNPRNWAQLRWFVLSPEIRGRGIGRRMLGDALDFARAAGFAGVYLETMAGLDAAAHLYRASGFRLVREEPGVKWGAGIVVHHFELDLAASNENAPDRRDAFLRDGIPASVYREHRERAGLLRQRAIGGFLKRLLRR